MDSNYPNIEGLLQKYWQGETTRSEEQQLRAFFTEGPVPAHLKEYIPIFTFFMDERNASMKDPAFSNRLARRALQQEPENRPDKGTLRPLFLNPFLRMAAGLALVLTLFFLFPAPQKLQEVHTMKMDTYENPQEAYQAAHAALLFLSSRIQKGYGEAVDQIERARNNTDFSH